MKRTEAAQAAIELATGLNPEAEIADEIERYEHLIRALHDCRAAGLETCDEILDIGETIQELDFD